MTIVLCGHSRCADCLRFLARGRPACLGDGWQYRGFDRAGDLFSDLLSATASLLQQRPPSEIKGRMICHDESSQLCRHLDRRPLYQLFERFAAWSGAPISSVFWMIAALVLPLAIFYRLDSNAKS